MSIDMYLEAARDQAASVGQFVRHQNQSYQTLLTALTNFVNESGLEGKAYDSAKRYSQAQVIPIVKGAILMGEALVSACERYVSAYESEVDGKSWKQSELEEKIEAFDRYIQQLNDLKKDSTAAGVPAGFNAGLDQQIAVLANLRKHLQTILDKLLAFNGRSPRFFVDVQQLYSPIASAIQLARGSWDIDTSSYQLEGFSHLPYFTQLNTAWGEKKGHKVSSPQAPTVQPTKSVSASERDEVAKTDGTKGKAKRSAKGVRKKAKDKVKGRRKASAKQSAKSVQKKKQDKVKTRDKAKHKRQTAKTPVKRDAGAVIGVRQMPKAKSVTPPSAAGFHRVDEASYQAYQKAQANPKIEIRKRTFDPGDPYSSGLHVVGDVYVNGVYSPELTKKYHEAKGEMSLEVLRVLFLELTPVNDVKRLFTGKDPETGEKANRWWAGGAVALEFVPIIGKLDNVAKVAKVAKSLDKVDDVADVAKVADKVDDLADTAKTVDKVDDVKDVGKTAETADDVGDTTKLTDKIASKSVTADDIVYSNKFKQGRYKGQVSERGWNNQMVADTINNPKKTTKAYNGYTDSSVTNYYIDDMHYVAVDDSNGKVIQISDRTRTDWRN